MHIFESYAVPHPDSLPEVEITRKPLPFKPSGNGFGGVLREVGGRRGRPSSIRDRRGNGRREISKKKVEVVEMIVLIRKT